MNTLWSLVFGSVAAVVLALWPAAALSAEPENPPVPPAATAGIAIALMPFAGDSQAPGPDYFADGVSEDILNALVRVPDLQVTARTSAFALRDSAQNLAAIREKLGVAYIVTGSIAHSDDTVVITALLTDVSNGKTVWTGSYRGTPGEIFALEDAVAHSIASGLGIDVPAGDQLADRLTTNPIAYDKLLQAKAAYRTTFRPDAVDRSIALLQQAIAIDPALSAAWAELAFLHDLLTVIDPTRADSETLIVNLRDAVAGGRAADPKAPDILLWSAVVAALSHDVTGSITEMTKAFEISPGTSNYRFGMGTIRSGAGLMRDARFYLELAEHTDPLNPFLLRDLAFVTQALGDYDASDAYAQRAAMLGNPHGYEMLAWNAFARGDIAAAKAHYRDQYAAGLDHFSAELGTMVDVETLTGAFFDGDLDDIAAIKALLRARMGAADYEPTPITMLNAARLGMIEEVMAFWPRAYSNRVFVAQQIWSDLPWARAFRQHPDFPAFAERSGMMKAWRQFGFPERCSKVAAPDQAIAPLACE